MQDLLSLDKHHLALLQVCFIELTDDLFIAPDLDWARTRWLNTRLMYHPDRKIARAIESDLADMDLFHLLDHHDPRYVIYRLDPYLRWTDEDALELARLESLAATTIGPIPFPTLTLTPLTR